MGFRLAQLAGGIFRAASSRRAPHLSPSCARGALAPLTSPDGPSGAHWFVPARGHGGHSHHPGEDSGEASEKIFRLGLAADVVLTVGKAFTGYLSGSTAITADAAHSLSDIVLSGVALLSYKAAKAPRDKDHPYGHGKFESLGALGISSMILKAGVQTGYESTLELVDAAVDPSLLEPIKETIVKVDGVKGCHRLRGRKAGTSLYLDVHIEVHPFLSVSAAHDIGETVRHHIQKTHNQVVEAFIHIDPSYSMGASMDKKRILENSERRNSDSIPRQQSAESIVSNIMSSHFKKKMSLEHLVLHYLQGRVLLQVQVSMPPEILIRDAMDIAKQAEEEIMKADASISQVSVQLRLGQQIEQLHLAASRSGPNDPQAEKQ